MKTSKIFNTVLLIIVSVFLSISTIAQSEKEVEKKFAEVNKLSSVKARKDYWREQTSEIKAALWREHFSAKLKNPNLTAEQKSIIVTLRSLYTVELVNTANNSDFAESEVGQKFFKAIQEAQKLFSRDDADALLNILGDPATLEDRIIKEISFQKITSTINTQIVC